GLLPAGTRGGNELRLQRRLTGTANSQESIRRKKYSQKKNRADSPALLSSGSAPLCAQVFTFAVAIPDQVQNPVQTQCRDGMLSRALDQWLGAERDPQARHTEHGQVVGTIAHGNHLFQPDLLALGDFLQELRFAGAIDDHPGDLTGDLAIDDFQLI